MNQLELLQGHAGRALIFSDKRLLYQLRIARARSSDELKARLTHVVNVMSGEPEQSCQNQVGEVIAFPYKTKPRGYLK